MSGAIIVDKNAVIDRGVFGTLLELLNRIAASSQLLDSR